MKLEIAFFPLACIIILNMFIVVKIISRFKIQKPNSKFPPGPWKLPVIGHLHHVRGLPHRSLWDLAKKHGPLMLLQLGEVPLIVVSSPKVAKEIMKTHDTVFADRPKLLAAKAGSYNYTDIVFAPFGKYWRQLRKICFQELFSMKKVQSMWSIREEEVLNLVEKIKTMAGSPVNLSEKFISLSNDITSRAAFGKKCKDKEAFLSLVEESMRLAGGFDLADLYPSLKILHGISGTQHKLEIIHQKLDKILQDIINEHRQNRMGKRETEKIQGNEEDVVDVLLRLQEDNDLAIAMEDDNIKAVIQDIFVAGSDTSSATVEWALAEMMRNPRVMEKAQTEVRQVLNGKRKVDQSDINKLIYLRLVIKETLRLHPATGLIPPRESREECEIDGYEIPKGTKIIVNAWAIGRDPEFWSNAESFEPERFQDISIDYKGNNFEYIPFGAGRRICPGLLFGIANIELPLAQLLYHFDWKLPYGLKQKELDMTEAFGAVVSRKTNLTLIPTIHSSFAVET
ncbi:hypothetical protein AQUCO_01100005v1 [Aquilegia coerulea]|uniref:Cytochrome P450 n=1 Tax=Aquilegia coerulea TaxID=218851 RepID=A0A2G5E559_AQUCA|nr:hypothetical protein AQUCO_01100005v1 [Aquilegia coerulea]